MDDAVDAGLDKPVQDPGPDVLVRYPTTPPMIAAVDAKYKHATTQAISRDDLHQLLTYVTAYPMPAPPRMIVHPVDGSWTHRGTSHHTLVDHRDPVVRLRPGDPAADPLSHDAATRPQVRADTTGTGQRNLRSP
ncbi:hypothetical protein [Rugosimonospora africana]|uniref:Uncharacterized protein n=1 Tax=Rugosimonospora africana TaxID=556532 RepID=A0A8J3QRF8_9ACTN|nr:hypothetical protein [Rugosimonospora africana]GIH15513.1 hypothetical protein Raf01_36850 [Rugosimonospora africana]